MLAKIPQFRGLSPWILMDFRSPMRQLPGVQDGYNRKGLISNHGEKKEAFFVLQRTYKDWASHGGPPNVSAHPVSGIDNRSRSAVAEEEHANPYK
jgi:hypothetical protein